MRLGIDFGTSNSAAGVAQGGAARLLPLEGTGETLPTAVFFDPHTKEMQIGARAVSSLIGGEEGRFMRALKSLLGTSLLHEERLLGGKRMTLADVIARFLAELKTRAEAATVQRFDRALSGRPVLFHSADPARNARAEDDLRACYLAAGFSEVSFLYEPEAALRAANPPEGYGLVADIGGGTSDFTLFKRGADGAAEIILSHGLRLGGTDFDRRLSLDHVMPLLGYGSQIRHAFGNETHEAPKRIFHDLATWQLIPFQYTGETRRLVADLLKYAQSPAALKRLATTLDYELGHDIAFAVEAAKIAACAGDAKVDLAELEPRLNAPLERAALETSLAPLAQDIGQTARETLARAGLAPEALSSLVLVGGSSLMPSVMHALQSLSPQAALLREHALTAVGRGLALASAA